MSTKLLSMFYGNCQMRELAIIFEKIQKIYSVNHINTVHKLTPDQLNAVHTMLPKLDLLVIQPISDRYKNNSLLSTTSILSRVNDTCKIIMMPVCYFNFYYLNSYYLKNLDKDYSEFYLDRHLVELYKNHKGNRSQNISKFSKIVQDPEFYTTELLETKANLSLGELDKRQTEMRSKYVMMDYIDVCSFMRKHYKDQLLFYTVNHPTNILLRYIMERIGCILGLEMDEFHDDPFKDKHPPLYKCLESVVNFDVIDYVPTLWGRTGITEVSELILDSLEDGIFKI